jgi:hypothetical protein
VEASISSRYNVERGQERARSDVRSSRESISQLTLHPDVFSCSVSFLGSSSLLIPLLLFGLRRGAHLPPLHPKPL